MIRFLWDGNTPFHEWEETHEVDNKQPKVRADYQADFMQRLAEREAEKARQKAEQTKPENLITWVFQDDFIPRGKLTRTGNYSVISDYLGTPVEAYDGEGIKVWERELDIYGRVKTGRKDGCRSVVSEIGEQCFIPFRFQGQYEDEEIGLYYNRFRYYDPSLGQYTQQDPIGLAGGNPTLYGYVSDSNIGVDLFGLESWSDVLRKLGIPIPDGLTNAHGHHIVFKGVFRGKKAQYIRQSKQILVRFGIGINDPANLMWASNVKGVHTVDNAKLIYNRLKEMEIKLDDQLSRGLITVDEAQSAMKQELQSAGKDVFAHY